MIPVITRYKLPIGVTIIACLGALAGCAPAPYSRTTTTEQSTTITPPPVETITTTTTGQHMQ